METGVEHRDMGDVGEPRAGVVQRCEGRRVVQRREFLQLDHLAPHRLIHQHRIAVARPAVNDAMSDCRDRFAANAVQ